MSGMSPRFPQPMGYSDFDIYGMPNYAHLTGGWPQFMGQQPMMSAPQAQFPMPSGHPFAVMNPWAFPPNCAAIPNQQMMNGFNQQLASQASPAMAYANAPVADMSSINMTSSTQSEADPLVSSTLKNGQVVQPSVLTQAPQPRSSARQEQSSPNNESIAPRLIKITPSTQGPETLSDIQSRESLPTSKQQTSEPALKTQRDAQSKTTVTSSKVAARSTTAAAKKRQSAESTRKESTSTAQKTKKRAAEEQLASTTAPKRKQTATTASMSVGKTHESTKLGQDRVGSKDISASKDGQTALVKVDSTPISSSETTPSSVVTKGKPALKNNRRACDECVEKRTRCSFAQEKRPKGADITNPGLTCQQCQASSKTCSTTKPKKKRGPEDGWALAPRLLEMLRRDDEQLLYRWCSSVLLSNHLVGEGTSGDNFDYLVSTRAVELSGEWKQCQLADAILTKAKKQLPGTETKLVKDEFVGEGTATRISQTPDRRGPGYRLATDLIDRRQHEAGENMRRQEAGAELQIINNFNAKCAKMQQDGTISKLFGSQPVLKTTATIPGTTSQESTALVAEPTTLAAFAPIEAEQSGRVEELDEPAVLDDSIPDHTATIVDQVLPTTTQDAQSTPQPSGGPEAIQAPTSDIPDQATIQQEALPLDQPLTAEDFTFDPNDIEDFNFEDLFGPEVDTTDFFSDASLSVTPWDEGLDFENLDFET